MFWKATYKNVNMKCPSGRSISTRMIVSPVKRGRVDFVVVAAPLVGTVSLRSMDWIVILFVVIGFAFVDCIEKSSTKTPKSKANIPHCSLSKGNRTYIFPWLRVSLFTSKWTEYAQTVCSQQFPPTELPSRQTGARNKIRPAAGQRCLPSTARCGSQFFRSE